MEEQQKIELRNLKLEDYKDLVEAMNEAYKKINAEPWTKAHIKKLLDIFPEGQLCIEINGRVVGVALSIIVDYAKYGDKHNYKQITDSYRFGTHDPRGDVLYGIEVFVHPEFRGMRLARRMYDARKELCETLNLKAIVAGGRIPNYEKYAQELKPKQYIEKVKYKEIYDPTLSFQLSNDFYVKRILKNYMSFDNQSHGYATLLEWPNVYYEEEEPLINLPPSQVRAGLVQWQMRSVKGLEQLLEQVEFFVDVVSGYKCDFLLFPEYFIAPLMAPFNALPEPDAVRQLAQFTEPLREKFIELAVSYNVNIITGSMPYIDEDARLLNVGYLVRRDGSWDSFEKIHITPSEANAWGMVGGDYIRCFDTDAGKIGILICYDVEFPELARLLSDEGMQILFVPFHTDTQNGFNRVRYCARARAIENECYVAITGSVGNLPKVENMDIQYAQSAFFSPCDFAFPTEGVITEATPNAEMILIADLNLDLLKDLHYFGSVHNLIDRRTDLYQLQWKAKKSKVPITQEDYEAKEAKEAQAAQAKSTEPVT